MRSLLFLLLGVMIVGCTHPGKKPTAQVAKADFYVATSGNDTWSGTLPVANATRTDGPFATVARARDALRERKKAGGHAGPWTVMVRGGTYHMAEPLCLGPDDSGTTEHPIIYCAYPGEQVTLSGGRPIGGWRKADGKLWVADVPEAKGEDGWNFRQLFVADERQIRARTPNFDPDNPITGGWAFVQPPFVGDKKLGSFGTSLACIHTPGDTFTWNVDVPVDGEYAVWFFYGANNKPFGNTTMAGRTTMQVDEGPPVTLQNLPDTGGWRAVKWSKTATLKLKKGTRCVRWTNVKGGGLDFDAFALCNDPAWTPKGTKLSKPATGKHMVLVHAETYSTVKAKEFRVAKGRHAWAKKKFYAKPGDFAAWPRSPEPEIHIFPAWGWVNSILSVDKVDLDKHIVHVKNANCTQELRAGNRYYVENVFEALDTPGEWFLDRNEGRLYYWPTEGDFAKQSVVAPRLDRLIEIAGDVPTVDEKAEPRAAEHIVIRGFMFRHTTYALEVPSVYAPDDGTIHLRRARHCVVEDCQFLGVGGYGVRLSDRASHNAILANTVADAGQGGLLMIGDSATHPTDNLVAGNDIRNCGTIWKHVGGVYVTTGSRNRIIHNTITDVPRYGISLKSYGPKGNSHGNTVEFNKLLRTNLETNDTGAIETLGRDRKDTGNVISYNVMIDSVGVKTTEDGEFLTPYYTWGIYLDDYSSGTTCIGNIIARTYRGGIHVHLGRNNIFENNILVDGKEQQWECNGRADMTNITFARNIVVFRQGAVLRVRPWSDKVLGACDHNVYWQVGGELAKAEGSTPEGDWGKWQAAGYDTHSVVADPLFVDPANDDYRLKPGSPALKLGFKPIPVDRIGVEGYVRPADLP